MQFEDLDINDERVIFVEAKPAGWAGDLPVQELFEALDKYDIPREVWPSLPSDNKCLERALHSLRSRRSLVRPLAKGKGFSLILERVEGLDLETESMEASHTVELTCKVEKGEGESAKSRIRVTPEHHPAVPLIKQEFERYRGESEEDGLFKCSQDLSYWFSQTIVPWCRGVATRARGGSYYIMKGEYLNRMVRVSEALASASSCSTQVFMVNGRQINRPKVNLGGRIILKPEVASTAAIEILIDNIINECDKTCDQLHEKLTQGEMGRRALRTQKGVAEDTMIKLKEYEKLLDTNLQDVKDRLEEVSSGLGLAELALLHKNKEQNAS